VDKTASVAGGNFRAKRETNEVVVAIRAELAVEQLASGDLERLNKLSGLDESNVRHFFSPAKTGNKKLTSQTMIKSPSRISLFSDHIWRDGC